MPQSIIHGNCARRFESSASPPITPEVFVLHAAALIPGILLTVLSAITLGSLLPELRRAKLDLSSRLIILVWLLALIIGISFVYLVAR